MSCLITTSAIRGLASRVGMNAEIAKTWIGYWQEQNNVGSEILPSVRELRRFINNNKVKEETHNMTEELENITENFTVSDSTQWPPRTKDNAQNSDITLSFAKDFSFPGEKLTKNAAGDKFITGTNNISERNRVPASNLTGHNLSKEAAQNLANSMMAQIKEKGLLTGKDSVVLNIAGNQISTLLTSINGRGINQATLNAFVKDVLSNLSQLLQKEGVNISLVKTGGQSGADLAGAIAARELGLNWQVHGTSDYAWNDEHGKRHSGKEEFMQRFLTKMDSVEEQERQAQLEKERVLQQSKLASALAVPGVTSVATTSKVDRIFNPRTRRDRVTMLAKQFSRKVDELYNIEKADLKKQLENPELSFRERTELRKQLHTLSRLDVIRKYGPGNIFLMIGETFERYLTSTQANNAQAVNSELNYINSLAGADRLSDEQKRVGAQNRVTRKVKAYNDMVGDPEVFKALCEEASRILSVTEGIKIGIGFSTPNMIKMSDGTIEDVDAQTDENQEWTQDEKYKDGWMTNVRQVSCGASLAQEVRRVISTIPKIGKNGKAEVDDLGFTRYLDASYVHASLLYQLMPMVSSDQMIPMLEEFAQKKSWVKGIVDLLKNDPILKAQFYQDFRKDFLNYSIEKKTTLPDGSTKWETININKPEGIWYLIDSWRGNYEGGEVLDSDAIYDKEGNIVGENAQIGTQLLKELQKELRELEEPLDTWLKDADNMNKIQKLLHMVGIETDNDTLRFALTNIKKAEGITFTDPIDVLVQQLSNIFKGITKEFGNSSSGKDNTLSEEGDIVEDTDLFNMFSGAYSYIARMIADVTENAVESNIYENGKSYYAHTMPNYLGKTIKELKGVNGDERFAEYMENEFGKYDWFKKFKVTNPATGDGKYEWACGWLKWIEQSRDIRNHLDHKIVLNSNKIEYQDLTSLDYSISLINEYWGDPESANSNVAYAWFPVPILSDSASSEFIKFRKIRTGDFKSKGFDRTYDDVILDEMFDTVNQEYDRIQLVLKRAQRYRQGDRKVQPITNWDQKIDKDGNVVSKGGAEFKFFPQLNDLRYTFNSDTGNWERIENPKNIEGVSFLDMMNELKKQGDGAELKRVVREALAEIQEDAFENWYAEKHAQGLFDEIGQGDKAVYKNLPSNIAKVGQSRYNRRLSTALKSAREVLQGFNNNAYWSKEADNLIKQLDDNKPYRTKEAENILAMVKEGLAEAARAGAVEQSVVNSVNSNLVIQNKAKEMLREYYWNSAFATSQIIQICTTDLAFYKNMEDFQKRFKEVHAPGLRLDTEAVFTRKDINGNILEQIPLGKKYEKTVYLKDDIIKSEVLNEIKQLLAQKVQDGTLSKEDANNIYSAFTAVNVADAQAYRTLRSYRDVLGMSGKWNDTMEDAFNNFENGVWDATDFFTIFQPFKPYVYTQIDNNSGVDHDVTGNEMRIKTPVQHKNSEFPILAAYSMIAGKIGQSPKLAALQEWMDDNGIDVVQFESTTKVGKQGVVDINDVGNVTVEEGETELTREQFNKAKQEIKDRLTEATTIDGEEDPNVVHNIPYADYGIQQSVPAHHLDTEQLIGTQIRKLIISDISDDAIFEIGEGEEKRQFTKREIIDLYQEATTENLLQSWSQVQDIFADPERVAGIIQEEIANNTRYGMELARACSFDRNTGKFAIPICDQIQSIRIQNLLTSVIKSRITKQKIKGGSLVQVSRFGVNFNNDLHVAFHTDENGNIAIDYIPCYMPAWSEKFFRAYIDPITGELDIDRVPEKLKRLIGYRIPTEDKYSMAPLKIMGFLPAQNGSAIMLPADITVIAGSDFDIDKLYIMLPAFSEKVDMKKAWRDFYTKSEKGKAWNEKLTANQRQNFIRAVVDAMEQLEANGEEIDDSEENLNRLFKEFKSSHKKLEFVDIGEDESMVRKDFKEFLDQNRSEYTVLEKIEYDFNKSAKENTRDQRNNLLIDIMQSILTNADTADKILNPGNFDAQRKAARVCDILNTCTEQQLRDVLEEIGIDSRATYIHARTGKIVERKLVSILMDLDAKQLADINSRINKNLDPLSPSTQVHFQQLNMAGANMIGIYANHNVNHSLMQLAADKNGGEGLELRSDIHFKGPVILNGKSYTSLHSIYNDEGERISKTIASYLAASVDNAKDQTLGSLNQNTFTVDVSMLLTRLGYNPMEVGLLMNQPIVKEFTRAYFIGKREGKSKQAIIDEVMARYQTMAAERFEGSTVAFVQYKGMQFTVEDLAENILIADEAMEVMNEHQTSDIRKIQFLNYQIGVGNLFQTLMTPADLLSEAVATQRSDTERGSAGPTIANLELNMERLRDFKADIIEQNSFTNSDDLLNVDTDDTNWTTDNIDELREKLLNAKIPMMQAFYTLGVSQATSMLKPYFPHFSPQFTYIIDRIRNLTRLGKLDEKTMNSVYSDLFAYIMSRIEFFGRGDDGEGNIVTSSQRRDRFINNFPDEFERMRKADLMKKNPSFANLPFIKQLSIVKANKRCPVDILRFKQVGSISTDQREIYMRDWASMLASPDPEVQKLALNLFRYSYYRNGFGFGPNTFMHLAPTVLKMTVPGYVSELETIIKEGQDLEDLLRNNERTSPAVMDALNELERIFEPFIDQYVRNHLENRRLVPEVKGETSTTWYYANADEAKAAGKEIADPKEEILISINNNSPSGDLETVKKKHESAAGVEYEFFDYVTRRLPGNTYAYYRRVPTETTETTTIYARIDPLGARGNFIEYEYGVAQPESVITGKVLEQNDRTQVRTYEEPNEQAMKDSYNEKYGQENDDIPPITAEDVEAMEAYRANNRGWTGEEYNFIEASEIVYGISLVEENNGEYSNEIWKDPNTEYLDAENQPLC